MFGRPLESKPKSEPDADGGFKFLPSALAIEDRPDLAEHCWIGPTSQSLRQRKERSLLPD